MELLHGYIGGILGRCNMTERRIIILPGSLALGLGIGQEHSATSTGIDIMKSERGNVDLGDWGWPLEPPCIALDVILNHTNLASQMPAGLRG